MRQAIRLLAAAVVAVAVVGVCDAQDLPSDYEHLKCFDPVIGRWVYEGPLLEDIPGIAEKGQNVVFRFSFKRILNRSVVQEDWSLKFDNGVTLEGMGLSGWCAAKETIVRGGMSCLGAHNYGTVTFDAEAKTSTLKSQGIDPKGEKTEFVGVITVVDKDALTWHAPQRKGGLIEGPSPKYTFERVERGKRQPRQKRAQRDKPAR